MATPAVVGRRWAVYHASVFRAIEPDRIEYYPRTLASKLPNVKIPLRKQDKDVRLDVQALIDEAYVKGRYDDIDYKEPLDPPLVGDEIKWLDQVLQSPAKS